MLSSTSTTPFLLSLLLLVVLCGWVDSVSLRGVYLGDHKEEERNANEIEKVVAIEEDQEEVVSAFSPSPNSRLIAPVQVFATSDYDGSSASLQVFEIPEGELGDYFAFDEGDFDEDDEEDPFGILKLAESMDIDLNEYNVTFDENDEKYDQRHLVGVSQAEMRMAQWLQADRKRNGLQGLSWAVDALVEAQKWSRYMASSNRLVHRSNLAQGISSNWGMLSENIAMNADISKNGAYSALMHSPGHRYNMMDPVINKLGIGIAKGGQYYFVCQIFMQLR